MLLAVIVGEVRNVVRVDTGALLVSDGLEEFPQGTGHGRAGAQGGAAQDDAALSVGLLPVSHDTYRRKLHMSSDQHANLGAVVRRSESPCLLPTE